MHQVKVLDSKIKIFDINYLKECIANAIKNITSTVLMRFH